MSVKPQMVDSQTQTTVKVATKVVSLTLSPAKPAAKPEAAPDKKEAPLEAKDTKPFKSMIE